MPRKPAGSAKVGSTRRRSRGQPELPIGCPSVKAAYAEAQLVRALQNSRALLKRKGLTERMKRELPDLIWLLESHLRDHCVDPSRVGWRPHPNHHGAMAFGLSVTFEVAADGSFRAVVATREPPRAKRRRRRPDAPPATPPDELMAALEASLEARVAQ